MASRRDFVTSGIALAALTAGPFKAALASGAASSRPPGPARDRGLIVVVDRTFAQAASFSAEAAALGYPVLAFEDDPGPLWMNALAPRLRAGPLAIAGLTAAATTFCLETLARDYRGRALVRREHAHQTAVRLAPLLAAAASADGALPPFAHVARAPHTAPAFLTWLIETQG